MKYLKFFLFSLILIASLIVLYLILNSNFNCDSAFNQILDVAEKTSFEFYKNVCDKCKNKTVNISFTTLKYEARNMFSDKLSQDVSEAPFDFIRDCLESKNDNKNQEICLSENISILKSCTRNFYVSRRNPKDLKDDYCNEIKIFLKNEDIFSSKFVNFTKYVDCKH